METIETVPVTVGAGIEGDYKGLRRGTSTGQRQVTVLLPIEGWRDACAELGAELRWTIRRANLLVEGLDLKEQTGARLGIGDLLLEITGEVDPCERMDAQAPGLTSALEPAWRGGVSCRVLRDGTIQIGDPIELLPAEAPIA
jgi:MOSC domain-containing protein YiiM